VIVGHQRDRVQVHIGTIFTRASAAATSRVRRRRGPGRGPHQRQLRAFGRPNSCPKPPPIALNRVSRGVYAFATDSADEGVPH